MIKVIKWSYIGPPTTSNTFVVERKNVEGNQKLYGTPITSNTSITSQNGKIEGHHKV
jgi:hypothetical protein